MKEYSKTMLAVLLARVKYSKLSGDLLSEKLYDRIRQGEEYFNVIDDRSNGMFSRNVLVRSLYFKDKLKNFDGDQIVVLGAGLDTKALEFSDLDNLIYVDHPKSLEVSKPFLNCITNKKITYVPLDLELDHEKFRINMSEFSNINFDKKTLIIWEGSSYYVSEKAILSLIKIILSEFSIFEFYFDSLNVNAYKSSSSGASKNIKYLQRINEKWIGYLDTNKLKTSIERLNGGRILLNIMDRCDIEKKYLAEELLKRKQMNFIEIVRRV
ncbi:TPA: class I SAM-dependent methyltransferase [Staphylococcus aureus]